jgi:hypothetical protein
LPRKKDTSKFEDKMEDTPMEEIKTEAKPVPINVPKASKPKEIKTEVVVVALQDVDKTNYNGVIYPAIKEGNQAKLPIAFAKYLSTIRDIDGHKLITIVK